jgi:toxin ParE1/3/4
MQVHKTDRFFTELEVIVDFIAQDSWKRAEKFANELTSKILDLPHFPYKCRQSQKSDDANIRELIYEGYIIPYRVDSTKENIVILGIFSENEWKL